MNIITKAAAAFITGAAVCVLSSLFCTSASAAIFIEGKEPPAEVDEYAKAAYSSLDKGTRNILKIPNDATLGVGFTPYTLDEDDSLKLFDNYGLYIYPLISNDNIAGQIAVNENDGKLSWSAAISDFYESLNDKGSYAETPIKLIVCEGVFACMDGEIISEQQEFPCNNDEYVHCKELLESGSVDYSKRIYNIAVESSNPLEYNVRTAGDDFYCLNGRIYKTEGGSFAHGWRTHGKYRYYFGRDGAAVTGKVKIGGRVYKFSKKGYLLKAY